MWPVELPLGVNIFQFWFDVCGHNFIDRHGILVVAFVNYFKIKNKEICWDQKHTLFCIFYFKNIKIHLKNIFILYLHSISFLSIYIYMQMQAKILHYEASVPLFHALDLKH